MRWLVRRSGPGPAIVRLRIHNFACALRTLAGLRNGSNRAATPIINPAVAAPDLSDPCAISTICASALVRIVAAARLKACEYHYGQPFFHDGVSGSMKSREMG